MGDFDKGKTLAVFDQLVSEGILVYGPHQSIVRDAEGYPVQFKVCEHLSKKPHTVGAKLSPAFDKSRKWGPGSDMYCPDERLILGQLNGTHDLAVNLFCVDRPQLLMLTLDSYKRQHEPLDRDDFEVALEVVRTYPDIKGNATVPFRFFLHRFSQSFRVASAQEVLDVYLGLIDQTRKLLDIGADNVCPHNIVMWEDYLIVIPRRAGFTEGASANAGGMMGCVWVPDEKHVDEWDRIGYANVLRELGVPSEPAHGQNP
ncbi:hypothetical protein E8E13_002267 [Curvularia kusanoi]|uniref:ATP adenylyltransferase C-terminal domain-containing protein n=1 Tax=Curvularia kusanoi TaxID=90978 RepID=A0A9P4T3A3_CURKU|nr:hypothetical protein E8E13_002267 [Curvularia kusanoi]